jgi:hypothetical protein
MASLKLSPDESLFKNFGSLDTTSLAQEESLSCFCGLVARLPSLYI